MRLLLHATPITGNREEIARREKIKIWRKEKKKEEEEEKKKAQRNKSRAATCKHGSTKYLGKAVHPFQPAVFLTTLAPLAVHKGKVCSASYISGCGVGVGLMNN